MFKFVRISKSSLRLYNSHSKRHPTYCFLSSFNDRKHRTSNVNGLVFGSVLSGFLIYKLYEKKNVYLKEPDKDTSDYGKYKSNLPSYTLEEISKHTTNELGIWVTFRQGVYDITNFVNEHPGGDQILLGAGNSVEPFWLLYGVHNKPEIYDMIESMRIGNISEKDAKDAIKNMSDPYGNDPKRHPVLKPASAKPFNAELPLSLLIENFISPNDLFYVRNHLPVPEIDVSTYELEIEVENTNKKIVLTYEQLKKLPKQTIIATIMCAGNRRSEMTKVKMVKGLDWGPAAIGNASFTGVLLRDVLKLVDVDEDSNYKHVQFEGLDTDSTSKSYGASIPLWKAVDKRGDVLLAYEMNGESIPRDHGFPIRVIVPGVVGARNVKWLGRIIVSQQESDSHWQQNDYKGFSPSVDWDTVDFSKSPAIQELPVISAICKPEALQKVQVIDGHILVQGYAWSGGGQKIIRVDLTIDCGNTWHVATLDHQDSREPPQHWAWTLWSAKIPVTPKMKNVEVWVKAVDSAYNTQPESFKNIWNLRGVLSNAYHRVPIELQF
ncbi:hypothetical protein FQR65_LT05527 [Abscondita terminalis]|nr:hypothetical protein FQR65_LT05527 [Abscondita terminalis]